jgi:hypothetical protein
LSGTGRSCGDEKENARFVVRVLLIVYYELSGTWRSCEDEKESVRFVRILMVPMMLADSWRPDRRCCYVETRSFFFRNTVKT